MNSCAQLLHVCPNYHVEIRLRSFLKQLLPAPIREAVRIARALTVPQLRVLGRLRILGLLGRYHNDRLPDALPAVPLVVFVCYGNIFRSPMAEALLVAQTRSLDIPTCRVLSAGLHAKPGRESPPEALAVAPLFDVSLQSHRAQLLTSDLSAAADLLVVMDYENEAILLERFPDARNRLVFLGAFDGQPEGAPLAIADPYGRGIDAVRACYQRLGRAVHGLTVELGARKPANC